MWVAFVVQKLLKIFSKVLEYLRISLTNDVASFEQLGPNVKATSYKALVYLQ